MRSVWAIFLLSEVLDKMCYHFHRGGGDCLSGVKLVPSILLEKELEGLLNALRTY